jgi:hypothetical protein
MTDAEHARAAADYLSALAKSLDSRGRWTAHDSAMAVHHFCACLGIDVPDTYADDVADELAAIEADADAEWAMFDRSRRIDARAA